MYCKNRRICYNGFYKKTVAETERIAESADNEKYLLKTDKVKPARIIRAGFCTVTEFCRCCAEKFH